MIEKWVIEEIEKWYKLNPQYLRLDCLYDNRNNEVCIYCVYSKSGRKEGEKEIDFSKRGVCRDMLDAFGFKFLLYD